MTFVQLVSVSKDGTAVIWDATSGNKLKELKWNQESKTKFIYKRCRYVMMIIWSVI